MTQTGSAAGSAADAAMTLAQFRALADAWGGDIACWPDKTRAAAALLSARSPEAAMTLAGAAALDAALAELDAAPGPAPSAALLAACARDAVAVAAARGSAQARARWPMAAMMMAAAVAGLAIGLSGALDAAQAPQDGDAALIAEDLLAPPDALAILFEEAT